MFFPKFEGLGIFTFFFSLSWGHTLLCSGLILALLLGISSHSDGEPYVASEIYSRIVTHKANN